MYVKNETGLEVTELEIRLNFASNLKTPLDTHSNLSLIPRPAKKLYTHGINSPQQEKSIIIKDIKSHSCSETLERKSEAEHLPNTKQNSHHRLIKRRNYLCSSNFEHNVDSLIWLQNARSSILPIDIDGLHKPIPTMHFINIKARSRRYLTCLEFPRTNNV